MAEVVTSVTDKPLRRLIATVTSCETEGIRVFLLFSGLLVGLGVVKTLPAVGGFVLLIACLFGAELAVCSYYFVLVSRSLRLGCGSKMSAREEVYNHF